MNANFNTRKTLEPPLKQRISAIKPSLLLRLVGDYVINFGCDLNTLIGIGLFNSAIARPYYRALM
jgi:hypothetical protein